MLLGKCSWKGFSLRLPKKKLVKFMNLKQEDMRITQYESCFNELSRFAKKKW